MKWNRFVSNLENPNPENNEYDIIYVESDSVDFAKKVMDFLFSDCEYRIYLSSVDTHESPDIENVKYYIESHVSKYVARVINVDELKELHLVD